VDQEEDQVEVLILKVAETEEILATQMTITAGEAGVVQNGQIQVIVVTAELQNMVVMEEMAVAARLCPDLTGHNHYIVVVVVVVVVAGGLGERMMGRQLTMMGRQLTMVGRQLTMVGRQLTMVAMVAVAAMGAVAEFN
jgi:hypothetical protein